jgi:hypothetical protein
VAKAQEVQKNHIKIERLTGHEITNTQERLPTPRGKLKTRERKAKNINNNSKTEEPHAEASTSHTQHRLPFPLVQKTWCRL